MIFTRSEIPGAVLIDIERKEDPRGFFARVACDEQFAAEGISFRATQASLSWNIKRGTLRGLHYQRSPHEETKMVRCTAGAIYDVLVDIRPASPAFGRWAAFELSAGNRRSLLVPAGVAHGFQTLADETEIYYQMTTPYQPDAGRGIRWDDPTLAIGWPLRDIAYLSDADRNLPTLAAALAEQ